MNTLKYSKGAKDMMDKATEAKRLAVEQTRTNIRIVYLIVNDMETFYQLTYCVMAFLANWKIHFAIFMVNDIIY